MYSEEGPQDDWAVLSSGREKHRSNSADKPNASGACVLYLWEESSLFAR